MEHREFSPKVVDKQTPDNSEDNEDRLPDLEHVNKNRDLSLEDRLSVLIESIENISGEMKKVDSLKDSVESYFFLSVKETFISYVNDLYSSIEKASDPATDIKQALIEHVDTAYDTLINHKDISNEQLCLFINKVYKEIKSNKEPKNSEDKHLTQIDINELEVLEVREELEMIPVTHATLSMRSVDREQKQDTQNFTSGYDSDSSSLAGDIEMYQAGKKAFKEDLDFETGDNFEEFEEIKVSIKESLEIVSDLILSTSENPSEMTVEMPEIDKPANKVSNLSQNQKECEDNQEPIIIKADPQMLTEIERSNDADSQEEVKQGIEDGEEDSSYLTIKTKSTNRKEITTHSTEEQPKQEAGYDEENNPSDSDVIRTEGGKGNENEEEDADPQVKQSIGKNEEESSNTAIEVKSIDGKEITTNEMEEQSKQVADYEEENNHSDEIKTEEDNGDENEEEDANYQEKVNKSIGDNEEESSNTAIEVKSRDGEGEITTNQQEEQPKQEAGCEEDNNYSDEIETEDNEEEDEDSQKKVKQSIEDNEASHEKENNHSDRIKADDGNNDENCMTTDSITVEETDDDCDDKKEHVKYVDADSKVDINTQQEVVEINFTIDEKPLKPENDAREDGLIESAMPVTEEIFETIVMEMDNEEESSETAIETKSTNGKDMTTNEMEEQPKPEACHEEENYHSDDINTEDGNEDETCMTTDSITVEEKDDVEKASNDSDNKEGHVEKVDANSQVDIKSQQEIVEINSTVDEKPLTPENDAGEDGLIESALLITEEIVETIMIDNEESEEGFMDEQKDLEDFNHHNEDTSQKEVVEVHENKETKNHSETKISDCKARSNLSEDEPEILKEVEDDQIQVKFENSLDSFEEKTGTKEQVEQEQNCVEINLTEPDVSQTEDAKNENTHSDNIEEGHFAVQEYEKTDNKSNQIDLGFEQGDIDTNDNEEHQEDMTINNEVEKLQIEDISPEENVKTIKMQEDADIRYDLDEENTENKIQAKDKSFENDEDEDKECNTKLTDDSIVEEITCNREEDEEQEQNSEETNLTESDMSPKEAENTDDKEKVYDDNHVSQDNEKPQKVIEKVTLQSYFEQDIVKTTEMEPHVVVAAADKETNEHPELLDNQIISGELCTLQENSNEKEEEEETFKDVKQIINDVILMNPIHDLLDRKILNVDVDMHEHNFYKETQSTINKVEQEKESVLKTDDSFDEVRGIIQETVDVIEDRTLTTSSFKAEAKQATSTEIEMHIKSNKINIPWNIKLNCFWKKSSFSNSLKASIICLI